VNPPAVFLSAGEASGDRHAATLAAALQAVVPGCRLAGIGGACMAAAGVRLVQDLEPLQAMGVVEALGSVPAHLRALRIARRELERGRYDVVVVVDYPGFHRRVAAIAARMGIPVLSYIAPQFWAWAPWRVAGHRRVVTHTAVILPFEERFFRERNVAATYVGHPLMDAPSVTRAEARASLDLADHTLVLGLFPGSRPVERTTLWPPFRDTAASLRQSYGELRVLVAGATGTRYDGLESVGGVIAPAGLVAAAADAAIAKSGTTTLELALAGTPHVLAYRMHPLTYAAARLVVSVPYVGLVNLVLGRAVVPELLQAAVRPAALEPVVEGLLARESPAASGQRAAFAELATRMGPAGAARRTADLVLDLVA